MNSADSFIELHDRKVNGPKGYKTTTMTRPVNGVERPYFRSYWRSATAYAPGFNFQVHYRYPEN